MKIPENLKSPEKERYEVKEQCRGEGFHGIFKSDNFGNANFQNLKIGVKLTAKKAFAKKLYNFCPKFAFEFLLRKE